MMACRDRPVRSARAYWLTPLVSRTARSRDAKSLMEPSVGRYSHYPNPPFPGILCQLHLTTARRVVGYQCSQVELTGNTKETTMETLILVVVIAAVVVAGYVIGRVGANFAIPLKKQD